MLTALADLPVSAADSARAAASVYTASLLATGPVLAAIVGAVALRRASAEGRVLAWRAAVVMLLIAFVGRLLPIRLAGWAVPSVVAAPLIALGRVRVATRMHDVDGRGVVGGHFDSDCCSSRMRSVSSSRCCRRSRVLARATTPAPRAPARADRGGRRISSTRARLSVRRAVGLFRSVEVGVPMTWGSTGDPRASGGGRVDARSAPDGAASRAGARARRDWGFGVASRVACALFWFHPGAWWIARSLRRDAEQTADDRVLASGVARSDYAELLISASSSGVLPTALALSGRGPLRSRLAAILDPRHDVRPLARRWALVSTAACAISAAPLTAVDLAPTRDTLATLMRDARWESGRTR